MEIRILGTKGNVEVFAPRHAKRSGVLIDGRILLDAGEPEFLDLGPAAVFITHLHPDHAFFIRRNSEVIVPVFAPEEAANAAVRVISGPVRTAGFTVTPIPTVHSRLVKSNAYLVEKDGRRILYTGDLIRIEDRALGLLGRIDLVITDGSFFRKGGLVRRDKGGNLWGHNGIPDLVRMFRPFARRIVFTHFGSWFFADIPAARKKIRSLSSEADVDAAYDGLLLTV
jgi:ribonuclease BN (tRNA processing enzyme)